MSGILSSLCCCAPIVLCEACGDCPDEVTVHINLEMTTRFGGGLCECDVTIDASIVAQRNANDSCFYSPAVEECPTCFHECKDQVPPGTEFFLLAKIDCRASAWEDFPCVGGFGQSGYRISITYGVVATPQAYFFHDDPNSHCATGTYHLSVCPPESGSLQGPGGHMRCSHLTSGTVFVTS